MTKYLEEYTDYKKNRLKFWSSLPGNKKNTSYYHSVIVKLFKNFVPKDSRILEIGSGSRPISIYLSPRMATCVDFCKIDYSRFTNQQSNINFIQLDAHDISEISKPFDYVIISDLVNDVWDLQQMLLQLQLLCTAETRIIINYYSHLWNVPVKIAQFLKIGTPTLPQNWLTPSDMKNFLEISDFELIHSFSEIILPIRLPFFSSFANRYIAKLWPFYIFNMANFAIARPVRLNPSNNPSVSIVIAARNESGHIDELISRIPLIGKFTEIIFVEGNSTDNTYTTIEEAIKKYRNLDIKLIKQRGKGKGDAVRTGFNIATGDVLMILDADITVPPEDLYRFYDLIAKGKAEFINGVRLVYPMENDAMRFFNLVGNKFFSWAFSWLLGQPIRDTLCGTKVLTKKNYLKIVNNRAYFGDFDPFGDFDLIFGAAKLNLKILEVPIRYRARRYGETNISRWIHGWLLLKMVFFAAKRIKFI